MTLSEVLLWNEINRKQLGYNFSRQVPLDKFIVDFYSKDLMLAIEVDGDSHFHDDQPVKDSMRQQKLEYFGIRFLRFDDADIKNNIRWVVNEILSSIKDNELDNKKK